MPFKIKQFLPNTLFKRTPYSREYTQVYIFLNTNLIICIKSLKLAHYLVSEITFMRKCEVWTRIMLKMTSVSLHFNGEWFFRKNICIIMLKILKKSKSTS